jgi:hypothetical protein
MQARVARFLTQELRRCNVSPEALCKQAKSYPLKIRVAEKLHRETPMTLRWMAKA